MPIAPSLLRELSPSRYAEVAKPADAWRSSDGKLVALSSEIELLYWPGRAVYDGHRLRHRLSLYDARLEGRLAVFDAARFPINDLAFHPSRPLIAVGTGSYDGGWFFEGDLWLWNWETGETQTLLGESRDVARCRWTEEGSLAVLLRPRDEEEFSDGGDEAFQTFVGVVLEGLRDSRKTGTGTAAAGDPRLRDLKPTDPATLGFSARPVAYGEGRRRFNDIMAAAEFESRARVWDLLWLTDAHLLPFMTSVMPRSGTSNRRHAFEAIPARASESSSSARVLAHWSTYLGLPTSYSKFTTARRCTELPLIA